MRQFLLLTAVAFAVSGCFLLGYKSDTPISKEYQTIFIPIFDNETRQRFLEENLTEALKEYVHTHTHLRIAPRDRADLILSGKMLDISFPIITERRFSENPAVQSIRISVECKLFSKKLGRDIRNFTYTKGVEYTVAKDGDSRQAAERALRQVAEGIVRQMWEDWEVDGSRLIDDPVVYPTE